MRRCCFFFLALVASIFLAVITGAFENRTGIPQEVNQNRQVTIAVQDDNPERNPLEGKANKEYKNPEP